MSQKKTPWFRKGTKPARIGVYETRPHPALKISFQRWDGKVWYFRCFSVTAAQEERWVSTYQNPRWRGLAQNPEAK